MTEKDRRLIAEAWKVRSSDWIEIFDNLVPQADTEEARRRLEGIGSSKYHTDEYYSGII